MLNGPPMGAGALEHLIAGASPGIHLRQVPVRVCNYRGKAGLSIGVEGQGTDESRRLMASESGAGSARGRAKEDGGWRS